MQEEEERAPSTAGADPVNTHYVLIEAELRAPEPLPCLPLTGANRKLMSIIGNTIHENDGIHLDAEIANNHTWQGSSQTYSLCDDAAL